MKVIPLSGRDREEAALLYLEGVPMALRSLPPDGIPLGAAYMALAAPDSQWWVLLDNEGKVMGLGGYERLNWLDGVGEPYIAIRQDKQGLGYGRSFANYIVHAGLNQLDLRRIQTTVLECSPSLGLLKKYGFKHEGTLRAIRQYDGKYVDAHCYALVKE